MCKSIGEAEEAEQSEKGRGACLFVGLARFLCGGGLVCCLGDRGGGRRERGERRGVACGDVFLNERDLLCGMTALNQGGSFDDDRFLAAIGITRGGASFADRRLGVDPVLGGEGCFFKFFC